MLNVNLNRRRRGQIRAIDFIVSLMLFLLMLSQLILVVINVQTGLNSQMRDNLTYSELDTFGRTLLQEEGETEWGYRRLLPNSFGLADSNTDTSINLDAAKISRIITGTTFPPSHISGFELFNYPTIKTLLGLDSKEDFQLSLFPYLNLTLMITETSFTTFDFSVQVTDTDGFYFLEQCQITYFTLDLTTGNVRIEGTETTNEIGQASIEYTDPNLNDLGKHINIAIAKKGPFWGINWAHPPGNYEDVLIGQESNATVWIGGLNSSSILISDIHALENAPETHFLSYIYENTQGSFTNESIELPSLYEGNTTINIPNNGLFFCFSIVKMNDVYKVGIGTYPAILDSEPTFGNFYQVFGKISEGTREFVKTSKTYPVYIRGTVMKCRIILWRSR